jgi:hypothetical protein
MVPGLRGGSTVQAGVETAGLVSNGRESGSAGSFAPDSSPRIATGRAKAAPRPRSDKVARGPRDGRLTHYKPAGKVIETGATSGRPTSSWI